MDEKNDSSDAGERRRRMSPGATVADRLAFHSIPEPNSGCHLWTSRLQRNGYPQITVGGKACRAHRVAYELRNGPIPTGMFVCHKCDVPSCVNPDHLFAGSHRENMADMMAKGRKAPPSAQSPLSPAQVLAIRADIRRHPKIAADYGVARNTISDIKRGVRWARLRSDQ